MRSRFFDCQEIYQRWLMENEITTIRSLQFNYFSTAADGAQAAPGPGKHSPYQEKSRKAVQPGFLCAERLHQHSFMVGDIESLKTIAGNGIGSDIHG